MELNAKDRKGIYLIIGVVVLLFTLFVLGWNIQKSQPEENFCIENEPGREYHTVILDITDEYDDGEIEGLLRFIENEVVGNSMSDQDHLDIHILDRVNIIDKKYSIPEPDFSKCKPKHPDDANPTYENPQLIEERYESFFDSLSILKNRISEAGNANESPIFEMIFSVSETLDLGKPNHLYLISDMLHNNGVYSQYANAYEFNRFKSLHSDYYSSIDPKLEGVEVNILYVPREENSRIQTFDHEKFWKEYFINQSVQEVNLRRL